MAPPSHWEDYYRMLEGRSPRPLLGAALDRFPAGRARHAVDLGSGDGTESLALLERGWSVTAIDAEQSAISRLVARTTSAQHDRLDTHVARFEDAELPAADLIYAGFSLPFCPPTHFGALWERIVAALPSGGRFAGELFGIRDSWASNETMTFHTAADVDRLLAPFDVERLEEVDRDGPSGSGPKHWHLFEILARKR